MGLFSSIGSALTSVGHAAASGLDAISATLAHPVTAVTQGINKAVTQTLSQSPTQSALHIAGNTAIAAAGLVAIPAIATSGIVGSAATKLISSFANNPAGTTKAILGGASSLVTTGLGLDFGYHVLKANPDLPSQTADFVGKTGTIVGNVTAGKETITQAGKDVATMVVEHPLATTATLGTIAVGTYEVAKALGLTNPFSQYDATPTTKSFSQPAFVGSLPTTTLPLAPIANATPTSPLTPIASLNTTPKVSTKRPRRTKKSPQTINRQTVNIYEDVTSNRSHPHVRHKLKRRK